MVVRRRRFTRLALVRAQLGLQDSLLRRTFYVCARGGSIRQIFCALHTGVDLPPVLCCLANGPQGPLQT